MRRRPAHIDAGRRRIAWLLAAALFLFPAGAAGGWTLCLSDSGEAHPCEHGAMDHSERAADGKAVSTLQIEAHSACLSAPSKAALPISTSERTYEAGSSPVALVPVEAGAYERAAARVSPVIRGPPTASKRALHLEHQVWLI